ncbi:MAG: STAS domain-containing protein [Candidatus Hydrogenedentota bacterium]
MIVEKIEHNVCTIIKVAGDLDAYGVVSFSDILKGFIVTQKKINIILDLKDLRMINSQCIGLIVDSLKNIRNLGGDIVLCSVASRVHDIFRILGLVKIFRWFDTREAAIAYYQSLTNEAAPPHV